MENPYKKSLIEIEEGLWDHDERVEDGIADPYPYDEQTFRACMKIFMEAIAWKLWKVTEGDPSWLRASKAKFLGEAIRDLVQKHVGIDTLDLYN